MSVDFWRDFTANLMTLGIEQSARAPLMQESLDWSEVLPRLRTSALLSIEMKELRPHCIYPNIPLSVSP